ncbi:hypothetical protein CIB95_10645 [Lottiidibacillus patelloidae]|uniref:Uncharacterized protein n=1 Tax=Lottiidibacillus patelloidae TaxID=2670334 RepID=A0A263BSJ8_9BACI|nr:hypothetical protein [Lottiidibacillus patelloidae]OZM56675.1 hypothetical protein CIB95_10645 [Lottiidibacillus patelloidae]
MLETGIKVIDVFAPITKGETVRIFARSGMGQVVVLLELIFRMKKEGFLTVLLKSEGNYAEFIEIEKEVDYVCQNRAEVMSILKESGAEKEVLLFTGLANSVWVETNESLQEMAVHSLTTIYIDLDGNSQQAKRSSLTEWHFDATLAQRYIYPAIDPVKSYATEMPSHLLNKEQLLVIEQAHKILSLYQELRLKVSTQGITKFTGEDDKIFKRGERIEAYLTQPFFVAETFTGQKGVFVPLKKVLIDMKRIIDGVEDKREVEKLKFIGSL